jgi:hypothetical protein
VTPGAVIRLRKELRALFVPWVAAMAGAGLVSLSWPHLAGLVAVPGALALGAWAVGVEYHNRTLPVLLSQPVARWQIGVEKLLPVAALIATLLVPAALSSLGLTFVAGVAVGAVCAGSLAALLTMWTRTPRAGILFAVAAMVVWFILTDKVPALLALSAPDLVTDPERLAQTLRVYGTVLLTVSCVAMLPWTFGALEALEETHEHVSLIRTGAVRKSAGRARPRHWVTALMLKEIGLQQVLFLVSALYLVGWLALSFEDATLRSSMTYSTTVLHGGVVALLAGGLACAEERRLGTQSWQALLPVSFGTQWTVKVAATLGLVLALALGLPAALFWLDPTLRADAFEFPEVVVVLVALATCALYVSALSRNGLIAFLAAVPASVVLWSIVLSLGVLLLSPPRFRLPAARAPLLAGLALLLIAGFLIMVLAFAMANHRAGDRAWRRLVVHGLSIVSYPILAAVLMGLLAFALRSR